MIKNFSKLLLCMALVMTSCNSAEEPAGPVAEGEKATVAFNLSRTDADEFAEAGINEITVFVYHVERKGSTLYSETTMPVGSGEFKLDFPLGETYWTFAVANCGEITQKDAYETVTLNLDPKSESEVWLAPAVKFATDKSVAAVSLTLSRRVAELTFVPAETADELAAITEFDNVNVTFANVSTSLRVFGNKAAATEVVAAAPASAGYKTTIRTFDTTSLDETGKLYLEFTKGGAQVNKSLMLDCSTKYASSKRLTMRVPITDPGILAAPWAAQSAGNALQGAVMVEVTDF